MVIEYAVKSAPMCQYNGCAAKAIFEHLNLAAINWETHIVGTIGLCSKHSERAKYGTLDSNASWVRREIP